MGIVPYAINLYRCKTKVSLPLPPISPLFVTEGTVGIAQHVFLGLCQSQAEAIPSRHHQNATAPVYTISIYANPYTVKAQAYVLIDHHL